jgi:2-oxoglutarate ferredoxin oxidoreductase subunit beta
MPRAVAHLLRGTGGTPFCPGCGHGVLMGAILRAVDNLSIRNEELVFVSGIGCGGWIPSPHFNTDTLHTLHGRAIPFATGAKLTNPALTVIVVSGDGCLAAIGGNHLIHAARRNTDITVICANNQIFGMTGGQSAPTTPKGVETATDKGGSQERPFDLCKLVMAAGASYTARYPVSKTVKLIQAVRTAVDTPGFTFVEAISPCPTQYGTRNHLADPVELYKSVDALCVTEEEAAGLFPDARAGRIVIGEFRR